MASLQRQINLIHYNIWRFERWTRYLIFGDGRRTTITARDRDELEDCIPFAIDSVDESMLPNYSGKHFAILSFLVLASILNVVCWLFGFDFNYAWFWGMIVCGILSFVVDFYLSERDVLLDEFKIFESMSTSEKRLSGVVTFLIVIAIWAAFVFSSAWYLRSLIASK